jgi:hypothetical protein
MNLDHFKALSAKYGLKVEPYGGNVGDAWFSVTKSPNQVLVGTNPAHVRLFGWEERRFFEATEENVSEIFEQWEAGK